MMRHPRDEEGRDGDRQVGVKQRVGEVLKK